MTLDDLERRKRHSCRNKQSLRSPPKNFNEDRSVLSEAKCRETTRRPMFCSEREELGLTKSKLLLCVAIIAQKIDLSSSTEQYYRIDTLTVTVISVSMPLDGRSF